MVLDTIAENVKTENVIIEVKLVNLVVQMEYVKNLNNVWKIKIVQIKNAMAILDIITENVKTTNVIIILKFVHLDAQTDIVKLILAKT
jgi:hypothetical protein